MGFRTRPAWPNGPPTIDGAHPAKAAEPVGAWPIEPTAPGAGRSRVVFGLVVAVLLVGAAWLVGGRLGFDQLGQSGVNSRLLPKVGEAAPDLVALGADGEPVFLSEFRGKPVWLNFWGSWCPPCRAEMPEMQAAWERLQPRGSCCSPFRWTNRWRMPCATRG